MNIQNPRGLAPQSVTTGPLPGSTRVYARVAPDIAVPFRQIALGDAALPLLRVYDASGPYTDPSYTVDLAKGLPRIRDPWLARRDGLETYQGRPVEAVDNGHVGADKLVPPCPAVTAPRRARAGAMATQYEFARAGIVTPEMIYVAHRENLGRERAVEGAAARLASPAGPVRLQSARG